MFVHYLRTAFRNLKKSLLFSFIHIAGLTVGIAACVLILHYVWFETSYEDFIPDNQRIYRLRYERISEDGSAAQFASCAPPAANRIRGNYPEIETIGRLFQYQNVVSRDVNQFMEERMFFADPEFLDILNIQTIDGVNTLDEPNRALISQSIAKKYFGDENPIGQTLKVTGKTTYQIAGVFQDRPQNTHLKMDILLSFANLLDLYGPDYQESWGETGMYTYVRLKEGANPASLEKQFVNLVNRECPWLEEYKMIMLLPLQPIRDIHLHSKFMQEYEVNGSAETVSILRIVAVFILIMAWVNYINLSTARALTRAREIGIRKVTGAFRSQIILQFLLETGMIMGAAVLLAFALIGICLPGFNHLTAMPHHNIWSSQMLGLLVAILLLGILIAGGYPALMLSSFRPIKVLRGKAGSIPRKIDLRKIMVVFQFIMAILMITGTVVVYEQIQFMRNRSLGFQTDHEIIVKGPRVRQDDFNERVITFKKELAAMPGIGSVAIVTEAPGRPVYWDAGGIRRAGEDLSSDKNYKIVGIDEDFVKTLQLDPPLGRNFSPDFGTEASNLILNEEAARFMGFSSPEAALHQQVDYWGELYTVVGVLKNYHQQSPKIPFEPHIYRYMPRGRGRLLQFVAHVQSGDVRQSVREIEAKYKQFFPGNPFEFYFLDDYFNQQYRGDEQFGKVIGLFALLALLITSLGILGLSAFMATQRIKEIGIRKVLGADIGQLVSAMAGGFVRLMGIAFLIAVPLLYWGIRQWLNGFAAQMSVTVWLFVPSLVIIGFVTAATMSAHVLKSIRRNPIEALHYE